MGAPTIPIFLKFEYTANLLIIFIHEKWEEIVFMDKVGNQNPAYGWISTESPFLIFNLSKVP